MVLPDESPIKGDMFFIACSEPWYGDVPVYLQTLKCPTSTSRDELHCICHHANNYIILEDTLYCQCVDCILCRCLSHEEVKIVLNDCHIGACGDHLSELETTQKLLQVG